MVVNQRLKSIFTGAVMRAIRIHEFGEADVLQLKDDVPLPVPKSDEVSLEYIQCINFLNFE